MEEVQVAISKKSRYAAAYCGDQCAYWQNGQKTFLCIADGLGHGRNAQIAAYTAIEFIGEHLHKPLTNLFADCNEILRHTHGVVMAVAIIDEKTGVLTYAGIGNIRAMVAGTQVIRLSNRYGIIGAGYKTLSTESVKLTPGDLVILTTDGIREMLEISNYKTTLLQNIDNLADTIIKEWSNPQDDAAVMIYQWR